MVFFSLFPLSSFLYSISDLKVLVIEYWNLRFICYLVLGICDLNQHNLLFRHFQSFPGALHNTALPPAFLVSGIRRHRCRIYFGA